LFYETSRFLRPRSPVISHFPKSKLRGVVSVWREKMEGNYTLKGGHDCPLAVVSFWEHKGTWAVKNLVNGDISEMLWTRPAMTGRYEPRRQPRAPFEANSARTSSQGWRHPHGRVPPSLGSLRSHARVARTPLPVPWRSCPKLDFGWSQQQDE
jgi:hypothetical protein